MLLDLELFDDQHPLGIEGAISAWRNKFWLALSDTNLFFVMIYNKIEFENLKKFLDI